MRPTEFLIIDLTVGVFLALLTIVVVRRQGVIREHRFYSVALAGAALLYVIFAMRAETEPARWLGIESLGFLAYGFVAYLGYTRSAWILVAGWLAHVAWDVALHGFGTTPFVPRPYPTWCAAYDVVIALYVALRVRFWRNQLG